MDTYRLEKMADTLASCVTALSAAGLGETASLIRIAHLDLISRVHDITDEELRAVAFFAGRKG